MPYTKNGLKTFSREKLEAIMDWPTDQAAEKLGVTKAAIYNYRTKIKKAGGIDAIVANQKKDPVKIATVNATSSKEVKYKEELNYLKEIGILDHLVKVIKNNMPILLVDRYINMLCKTIHEEKLFSRIDFFDNVEFRLENILKELIKNSPIPEKVVEIEKVVEKEKLVKVASATDYDRPLANVFTSERIVKEYPQFFVNPLQVQNFIRLHLYRLVGHSLKVGDQYIVDEYGCILLMELADKTMDDGYSLPATMLSSEGSKTVTKLPEEKTVIEYVKEEVEDSEPEEEQQKFVPIKEINETLLDRTAKPSKRPRELKGYYKANKDFIDSLNAFRYWTDTHQQKVDAGEIKFTNYCDDEIETGKDIYLINSDPVSVYLYMKKSDFNNIMQDFYKENRYGPAKMTKILEIWKQKGLIEKSNSISNSYMLDYNKIKQIITEKGGILNSIPHMR